MSKDYSQRSWTLAVKVYFSMFDFNLLCYSVLNSITVICNENLWALPIAILLKGCTMEKCSHDLWIDFLIDTLNWISGMSLRAGYGRISLSERDLITGWNLYRTQIQYLRQSLKGQYHTIFSNTLKIEKMYSVDSSQDIMTKIPLKDYQNAR